MGNAFDYTDTFPVSA